jgi:hypothetical protein
MKMDDLTRWVCTLRLAATRRTDDGSRIALRADFTWSFDPPYIFAFAQTNSPRHDSVSQADVFAWQWSQEVTCPGRG